jgi:hypothetical protein
MVVSDDVLKDNGLTKIERIEGTGFVIDTEGVSHVFITDELLAILTQFAVSENHSN